MAYTIRAEDNYLLVRWFKLSTHTYTVCMCVLMVALDLELGGLRFRQVNLINWWLSKI